MVQHIRWRSAWDTFVTVATVATCAYVVLTIGVQKVRTGQSATVPVGTILKPAGGLSFGNADLTVLIGMSSTCHFCQGSLPAFRELTKYFTGRSTRSRVVALSLEPADALGAYLAKNGLADVKVISVESSAPLATIAARTPQIVAVDSAGKVLASWTGQMSDDQMRSFVSRLPTQTPR